MRIETEIRETVERLKRLKSKVDEIGTTRYSYLLGEQIHALEWVLGADGGNKYYCFSCDFIHEGERCPICDGDKVFTGDEVTR